MPIDFDAVRARARALVSRQVRRTADPHRPAVPSPTTSWIPVVLRSIDVEAGDMQVQRIRYADSPPVVGNYEATGAVFRAYPFVTSVYEDYGLWVWPDDEDHPLGTLTVPLLAANFAGHWQVMLPLKGDGSVLPAEEAVSGCNFG